MVLTVGAALAESVTRDASHREFVVEGLHQLTEQTDSWTTAHESDIHIHRSTARSHVFFYQQDSGSVPGRCHSRCNTSWSSPGDNHIIIQSGISANRCFLLTAFCRNKLRSNSSTCDTCPEPFDETSSGCCHSLSDYMSPYPLRRVWSSATSTSLMSAPSTAAMAAAAPAASPMCQHILCTL